MAVKMLVGGTYCVIKGAHIDHWWPCLNHLWHWETVL